MLIQEARYAFRLWRVHPFLIGAAVWSLGVGMGANTALFSVLNAALLTTAPVADPNSLFLVYSTTAANSSPHGTSFQNYEDLRKALTFETAATAPISIGFSSSIGQPEELPAELVSDNYFDLIRARTALGRAFATGRDTAPGSNPTVVISHSLWQRRFSGRPDVVGERVSINARPFTILGVAAEGFSSLDILRSVDVWIPVAMHQEALTGVQSFYFRQRSGVMFDVVGRAEPRLTSAAVLSMLRAQANALATAYPKENKGLGLEVRPLRQAGIPPARRVAWVRAGQLMGAVVIPVLLIACLNVANLLLARSAVRQREIAVREAIGATRRVSLVLSAIGLFGCVSRDVVARTRELVIRSALGATFLQIANLFLKDTATVLLLSAVPGVGAALAAARVLKAQTFGVSGTDLTMHVGAVAALALVAMVATMLPLRRLSRTRESTQLLRL